MKVIESTAEILALKVLNRNIDKRWVTWAFDMLMAGFETENLIILAGELEPYNQFELISLTNKILDELNIDISDQDKIIKNYTCYLINKALTGEMQIIYVLNKLKDLCIELDYER